MRNILPIAALLTMLSCLPSDVRGQNLTFEIKDGLVTLDAQNVSVWEILQRWAGAGGVNFVDADQIPRTPVTLSLTREPEMRALEILLRGVSGYIVARREPSDIAPPSSFDRVLIVANSVAPRAVTGTPVAQQRAGIAVVHQEPPVADDDAVGDPGGVVPFSPGPAPVAVSPIRAPAAGPGSVATGGAGRAAAQRRPGQVSPEQQPQAPLVPGAATGMVDDFGNPVIGPTAIPEQQGNPSTASSPGPAPNQSGATGSSRPGTISPVQRSQP